MNKKHVESLWLLANKMRGAFEISDFCKVMIYSLFLKYIELKKREPNEILSSYDEKFSIGYLALTYGKMIRAQDIACYVSAIEPELQLKRGIISEEIGRLLKKADDDQIKIILNAINEIVFDSNQDLYQMAQLLLNKLAISSRKMSSEAFINISLTKLETRLLNCQDDMLVYDGFCGYGLSVNEVAANKGTVYMQDVNVSTIALATVITLLKGNKVGAIRCGDSQLNPLSSDKYDRIVCEPPFKQKYEKDYFISIPQGNCIYQDSLDSESLALRHVLSHLKDDGIATVLVPMGILFKSGRGAGIREKLIQDKYIDAVIELPAGLILGTGVATALLVLKKNKMDKAIYMINAKNFFERVNKAQLVISDDNINKIVDLYNHKETVEGISKNTAIEEIATNGFNLCTTQYVLLNPEDTITIEDTTEYVHKYNQLVHQLIEVDKQLGDARSRFVKEV